VKDNQKKIDDYFKKPREKKEPEKLEKYMENLQQKDEKKPLIHLQLLVEKRRYIIVFCYIK